MPEQMKGEKGKPIDEGKMSDIEIEELKKLRDKAFKGSMNLITDSDKDYESLEELREAADKAFRRLDDEKRRKTSEAVSRKIKELQISDEGDKLEEYNKVNKAKVPAPSLSDGPKKPVLPKETRLKIKQR